VYSLFGWVVRQYEANFPLGHREARNGVHHQQNVLALISKVLGNCHGYEAGSNPQWCGAVRSRGDHNGPC
jgi:hypothetical protein